MELLSIAGGAFLTIVFERLFNKLEFSRALNLQKQVLIKLQQWESLSLKIYALLEDAERTQMSNSSRLVKMWLDDLRDLAYDMEDVLDEFVTDARRSNVSPKPQQAGTSKLIPSCFNCFKQSDFVSDSQAISKVDDITLKLQHMIDESKRLSLISSATQARDGLNKASTRRLSTSSLPEPYVYGRESDKAAILQKLLNDEGNSSKGFCVVPIYGMGGVGKTTLAQLVYNEVKPESFELKAWVCVSDQIDIPSITKTILEAVGGKCDSNDLNLLQQELNKKLSNKKFLLVLDDIWNENYSLWDSLQKPFLSGAAGSKIMITTRSEHVVKTMRGMHRAHHLGVLKEAECLSIFAQHALEANNFDAYPSLKEVGEKIVKKCKGLPLAAKTLGGLLCDKFDHSTWEHILNSEIWDLQENEGGILPVLRLSYYYLPSYLKPCFAYCAVFPKDYEFDKNKLVLLWMAMGLVQQQHLEEVGHRYFDELVSRAFFQRSSRNQSRYVMHDLIHDLAQSVAGKTSFNLENLWKANKKSKVNFEKVRHLSFYPGKYDVWKKFEDLNDMKSLRTFIPIVSTLQVNQFCYISNTVVHDQLPKLRCLRALSLQNYMIQKLPDSIGDLKCLKYLNLSGTSIESLPESVGFLLQLHTLLLFNCNRFSEFPLTIGNLIDLHHLNIKGTSSLKKMPAGIANLKNLLTLSKFMVGKANGLMRLSDLKNFSQLRGKLSILNLHNVFDIQDAREANLDSIHGLDELFLEWTSNFSNSRDRSNGEMQVLNCLKPHSKLKSLKIVFYGGHKFPLWMGDPLFSNLSYLELRNCERCTLLPSLGLLPVLKELNIEGMNAIEAVGLEFYGHGTFPSLETLVFGDMLNWKGWASSTGSGGEFPCLRKLVIQSCPKLVGQLPSSLCSLIHLNIHGCPKLRCSSVSLPSLKELEIANCNAALLKSMVDLTSVTRLRINGISELNCMPKSFVESLTMLQLSVIGCKELTCLWEEGAEIANLACLEGMTISNCPQLVCLSGKEQGLLPFNVRYLFLRNCGELESLSNVLMMNMDGSSDNILFTLEDLTINSCSSLKSFPGGKLPTTIKSLRIESCKNLESLLDLDNSSLKYLRLGHLPSLNSFHSGQLPDSLESFSVYDCKGLESFPERMLQHCTRLEWMDILSCDKLKRFPIFDGLSNLVHLGIENCEVLESLPKLGSSIRNLESLTIKECKSLKTLPDTMYQLQSLQSLCIADCPGIECITDGGLPPNLTSLVLKCENLMSLPHNMVELRSLQILYIPDGRLLEGLGLHNLNSLQDLTICQTWPPDTVLPSSLTSLCISNCPELRSLPREGLPPLLGNLSIINCQHLKRQRFEAKGDYLHVTRSIPRVWVV